VLPPPSSLPFSFYLSLPFSQLASCRDAVRSHGRYRAIGAQFPLRALSSLSFSPRVAPNFPIHIALQTFPCVRSHLFAHTVLVPRLGDDFSREVTPYAGRLRWARHLDLKSAQTPRQRLGDALITMYLCSSLPRPSWK
jgi:hypothetical protein